MEDKEIAFELAEIANELYAREASNNCPNSDLRGISWNELCNKAILLAAKLKTPKKVDMELCYKEGSHYSYCDSVYDLIDDALYVETFFE